jgi:hypothetical protein
MATFKDLQKAYPEYETYNEEEEDRLEKIKMYAISMSSCRRPANVLPVSRREERAHQRRSERQKVYEVVCSSGISANLLKQNRRSSKGRKGRGIWIV